MRTRIVCFYPRHPRGWRRYNDKNTPKGVNGFYPRHPRGWRLYEQRARTLGTKVSIHATLAGGDVFARCAAIAVHSFYPRHPRGWRPLSLVMVRKSLLFLSTPPSRVATSVRRSGCGLAGCFYPRHPRGWRQCVCQHYGVRFGVSIHATLAGGDGLTVKGDGSTALFLSTPPSRVATWQRSTRKTSAKLFLSTPPSRVATRPGSRGTRRWDCFYPRHPRGWRRRQPPKATFRQPCFYPRHPRGWRRYNDKNTPKGVNGFYPRHPRGWRPPPPIARHRRREFLSTPPSRVATTVSTAGMESSTSFYPRHPRGWRRHARELRLRCQAVSIHATLAGGDRCVLF